MAQGGTGCIGADRDRPIIDPVNGPTSTTSDERLLLGTSSLQRLQRISQLQFCEAVFPRATHTRYAHTLGVLQLTVRVLENPATRGLVDNLSRELDWPAEATERMLRAAAILHDIGQGPYSHWSEMLAKRVGVPTPWVKTDSHGTKRVKLHEWFAYAALSIDRTSSVRELLEWIVPEGTEPEAALASLPESDLAPMAELLQERWHPIRASIEAMAPTEDRARAARDHRAKFAHAVAESIVGIGGGITELLYGDADVDRLDYLHRDAVSCGVAYGICEAERLLSSALREDANRPIIDFGRGIAALENVLVGRALMRYVVHLHPIAVQLSHVVSRTAEATFRRRVGAVSGDLTLGQQIRFVADVFRHGDASLVHTIRMTLKDGAERRVFEFFRDRRLYKKLALVPWAELHGRIRADLQRASEPGGPTKHEVRQYWESERLHLATQMHSEIQSHLISKIGALCRADALQRKGPTAAFLSRASGLPVGDDFQVAHDCRAFEDEFGPVILLCPPIPDDDPGMDKKIVVRRGTLNENQVLTMEDVSPLLGAVGKVNSRGTYLLVLLHPNLFNLLQAIHILVSKEETRPDVFLRKPAQQLVIDCFGLKAEYWGMVR